MSSKEVEPSDVKVELTKQDTKVEAEPEHVPDLEPEEVTSDEEI